ncbi:MAG: TIM barrel protein [Cyclobacteriaceae bacterium]
MKRKQAIQLMTTSAVGIGIMANSGCGPAEKKDESAEDQGLMGNVNHSACKWCYDSISLDQFCEIATEIGLVGIDLLKPSEWKTVVDEGLRCTMGNPEEFSLTDGFNDPSIHEQLQETYAEIIPIAADLGLKNIICFSGNSKGLDLETGLENCAVGLDPLVKLAEQHDIQIMMELLNSKVDHQDYMCDKTPWGVALCEKIGSPNFQLLYDIYHMQIMEGDVIATIKKYNKYIGHYHTGGVPGRNEIDETQELYYPAIVRAILETGFQGVLAQEFIPKADPVTSLKEAVQICDV